MSLPLEFQSSGFGDGRKQRRVTRAIEAEEDWWAMCPEAEQRALLRWAIMGPIGLCEKRWIRRGGRLLPTIRAWNPRWLRFDSVNGQWLLTVSGGKAGARTEIKIYPGEDHKWSLFALGGADRPWAQGAYRALARWSLLKELALRDWGSSSERYGQGIKVVECAGPIDKSTRDQIVADVRNLGANAVIALPVGFKLELVEAAATTWGIFDAQINAATLGITTTTIARTMRRQQDRIRIARRDVISSPRVIHTCRLATQPANARRISHRSITYLSAPRLVRAFVVDTRHATRPLPLRPTRNTTRTIRRQHSTT
jgi:hypothetical protein